MSSNSSKALPPASNISLIRRIVRIIGFTSWVLVGFVLAQVLFLLAYSGLEALGISFDGINTVVLNTVGGAVIYSFAILLVLGLPALIKKGSVTKESLGLHRFPAWLDFVWAPLGFVAYLLLTSLISGLAEQFLTFVDYAQEQETGFSTITTQLEYVLAFISLVIIAPIAEEILFRGYLFGKLRKYAPLWLSIIITSALFGLVHGQWNVAIDVFALSIVLCLLRVWTGSLWPSILLHMVKNGIAFYFLFVNPGLLSTLGG